MVLQALKSTYDTREVAPYSTVLSSLPTVAAKMLIKHLKVHYMIRYQLTPGHMNNSNVTDLTTFDTAIDEGDVSDNE